MHFLVGRQGGKLLTAYQSTGYIVQHSSLLQDTSVNKGSQSVVIDQHLSKNNLHPCPGILGKSGKNSS